MFDQNYYLTLSLGRERMNYLKKCIDEADKEKEYKAALELRYLHIKESTFNDDNLDSLIVFPEYMALFDKHPDLHDKYLFMYAFKWIIESIMNFPQVSIEMAESYFEEFKRRCEMYGYTKKVYYMKQINFFEKIDPERVMRCLELFRAEDSDDLSDGKADDISLEICAELDYGSEKKALSLLREMKLIGLRSGEVPQITYGKCVEYFTKKGNLNEAEYYADLLIPMTRGTDTYYMMEMSHVMVLKTFTNTKTALSIFRRYIPYFISGKNPKFRFYFASASYQLFKTLFDNQYRIMPIKLPREFELYEENNTYSVEKLRDYFKEQGAMLAEKFDKRNHNTMFSDMLNFEYPTAPIGEFELPEHPTTERVLSEILIPYKSQETMPSCQCIVSAVEKLPDTVVIEDNSKDASVFVLSVRAYNEKKDIETEFTFSIKSLNEDCSDVWDFPSSHEFPPYELELAKEEYKAFLSIDVKYGKNAEGYEFNLMLKLADMLNFDYSPVIFDMNVFKLLSEKWVHFQAQTAIPPYEFYMCRILSEPSATKGKVNLFTFGLGQFGYKNMLLPDIDEKNKDMAYMFLAAIGRSVCSNQPIPDKGEKAFLNAFYNDEAPVFYSWRRVDEIENDFSDKNNQYIIPEIHFGYEGEAISINDMSYDDYKRIVFRAPARYYNIDAALSRERFGFALEVFEEKYYESFDVGFEVRNPNDENENVEIFARVEDAAALTAIILDGADFDGLRAGDKIKIDPKTVYFWKMEKDGRVYYADNAYLLM